MKKDEFEKTEEDILGEAIDDFESMTSEELIEFYQTQAEDYKAKYLEALADSINIKKRTDAIKGMLVTLGEDEVLKQILSVIDDFERALAANETVDSVQTLKESFEVLYKKFCNVIQKFGVSKIDSTGAKFDPEYHEAFATVPVDAFGKKADVGDVYDTLESGYMRDGKVLRHAKVVVVKED